MKKFGVHIEPPSINLSDVSFTPKAKDNKILYGIGAIAGINTEITKQILSFRPYTSFADFYNKNNFDHSLVTKSKFIQLIKSGCFDEFEPNRLKTMIEFFTLSTQPVKSLAMNNIGQIKAAHVQIPKQFIAPYNFKKYVCSKQFFYSNHPTLKSKKVYWLDDKAMKYFDKNCRESLTEGTDWWLESDRIVVVDKSLEKLLKPSMDVLKGYINTPEFIQTFNKASIRKNMEDSLDTLDVNRWVFSAISFYPDKHELACIDRKRYDISLFNELPEEPQFVTRRYGKREWRQYALAQIACVVIDKDDNRHILTVLDMNNNVVQVKFTLESYAYYRQQISETDSNGKKIVLDKPWFKRGQALLITGYRSGPDELRPKKYKNSIYSHTVQRIDSVNNETGEIEITTYRYGEEEN